MRKVAIYARVSTEHEAQLSALDNQVQYYDERIKEHPDWELYNRYIDEGITGTSIKKRKNFLKMIEDAKKGYFDLIVTREVSRFARNTVDTLQVTRDLKKYGVEVYFTEDNIWTFQDDDGELKLTIMATLAQNESKKISQRVKAGQKISFLNGVFYGTGNILGYDKVGKDMLINEEQAKTVKFIFESFLQGYGSKQIAIMLEENGMKTATGLNRWEPSSVCRILRNSFYCGIIEYRKSYIPDFLEQKAQKNNGQVEKIIVTGRHKPIISKQDFDLVQAMLEKHKVFDTKKQKGIGSPKNVWTKKLVCNCGSSFNRTISHRYNDMVTYQYICYNKKNNGSLENRKKLGLDISNSCDVKCIQEWKLNIMSRFVFDTICNNKEKIIKYANQLIDETITRTSACDNHEEEIKNLENRIRINDEKIKNILNLVINNVINWDDYLEKKTLFETQIIEYKNNIKKLKEDYGISKESLANKIEDLKKIVNSSLYKVKDNVSDDMVDLYIDRIKVFNDHFEWKLKCFNEEDLYQQEFLARIIITQDDLKQFIEDYPELIRPRMKEDLIVDIFI